MATLNVGYKIVPNDDGLTQDVYFWPLTNPTAQYTFNVPLGISGATMIAVANTLIAQRKAAGLDYPGYTPPAAPTMTVTV